MANFNLLQAINPGQAIGNLPTAPQPQEDGLMGVLGGLGKLIGSPNTQTQANPNPVPTAPGIGLPPIGLRTSQDFNPVSQMTPKETQLHQVAQGSGLMPDHGLGSLIRGQGSLGYSPRALEDRAGTVPNDLSQLYKRPAFQTALQAQQVATKNGIAKSPIMTVVDYSLPSDQKRLWVVDTQKNQVLMNTYVAHGSGSGKGRIPTSFSNTPESHQTSLGTYVTDQEYQGKHGDSLRVRGIDKGVNDNAFQRAIVVHGGNYIGPDKQGTSWGCFTVPNEVAPKLIGLTKNGSIIHAYAPDSKSMINFGRTLSAPGQTSLAQQFNPIPNAHPELQYTLNGIAHVESQGNYNLVSKPSRNGDKAYGKYQIMGNNIPGWTREALGTPMTTQQFLADPQAQERVAAFKLNQSLQQGYSPEDAASIWFSGRPQNKAGKAKDAYGTTIPQYINKFNKGYLQSKSANVQLTMSNQPSQPHDLPNIKALDPKKPIRELTPDEIKFLMTHLQA